MSPAPIDEVADLLRALVLPHMRAAAPELLATAKNPGRTRVSSSAQSPDTPSVSAPQRGSADPSSASARAGRLPTPRIETRQPEAQKEKAPTR